MNVSIKLKSRFHFVDILRIIMMSLVVLNHMTFVFGSPGRWYLKDNTEVDTVTKIIFIVYHGIKHTYLMSFFFFVAGLFTSMSLEKSSISDFLKKRLIRLGVPLLIYDVVIHPLLIIIVLVFDKNIPLRSQKGLHLLLSNLEIGAGPFWFIESLIIFTLLFAVLQFVSSGLKIPKIDIKGFPGFPLLVFYGFVIGIITFIMRYIFPPGHQKISILTINFPLVNPQYIFVFFAGIAAYKGKWLDTINQDHAHKWGLIIISLIFFVCPLAFILGGGLTGQYKVFEGGWTWQSFIVSLWEQYMCIGILIVLFYFFKKHFNKKNSVLEALSDSVFGVYLIHAPVILSMTFLIRKITGHPLIKLLLSAPFVIVICFVIALYLRKIKALQKVM